MSLNAVTTKFYIDIPHGSQWLAPLSAVVEAKPITPDTREVDYLDPAARADSIARKHLVIVKPEIFSGLVINTTAWRECAGPARKLSNEQYVEFYRSLDPYKPLPKLVTAKLEHYLSTALAQ